MNKYEIISKLEEFAPLELAEAWDCSGWLIETAKNDISKVMLCLTPTLDVINQAKLENCDLIISHHPMFFVPFFTPQIDIYSMHTNFDKTKGGTTDILIDVLFSSDFAKNNKVNIDNISSNDYLRIVTLEDSFNFSKFIDLLRYISPNLRYVNNKKLDQVKKIAFCCGSGSEFIDLSRELGADIYVTGDLKFHTALDSEIALCDLGHFESEIVTLKTIEKLIKSSKLDIVYAKEKSPFIY